MMMVFDPDLVPLALPNWMTFDVKVRLASATAAAIAGVAALKSTTSSPGLTFHAFKMSGNFWLWLGGTEGRYQNQA